MLREELRVDIARIASNIVCQAIGAMRLQTPAEITEFTTLTLTTLTSYVERSGKPADEVQTTQEPAIAIKRSVTPDYIICLEDGKKFKSLKRHLMTHYELTPEQYRARWNLPHDYPMVAPNYAEARSALAKKMGLGRKKAA